MKALPVTKTIRLAVAVMGLATATSARCQTSEVLIRRPSSATPAIQESLHERALKSGAVHEEIKLPEGWVVQNNVHDLTIDSDVVIVGFVHANKCELDANSDSIATRYQVLPEKVYRDRFSVVNKDVRPDARPDFNRKRVEAGTEIQVVLPGGKIRFPEGVTAQVDVLNSPRMVNGGRYLFYLKYSPGAKGYIITGLSRGIFEVANDGDHLRSLSVRKLGNRIIQESGPASFRLSEAADEGAKEY